MGNSRLNPAHHSSSQTGPAHYFTKTQTHLLQQVALPSRTDQPHDPLFIVHLLLHVCVRVHSADVAMFWVIKFGLPQIY